MIDILAHNQKAWHTLPYSNATSISEAERIALNGANAAYEFGHTLTDQIGGQLAAGFLLADFCEDVQPYDLISAFAPSYIATKAVKPTGNGEQ
jgi:hypothetical protein